MKNTSWILKLKLLLVKNLILRWRLLWGICTLMELLFPILASVGIGIMFSEILANKSSVVITTEYIAPVFEFKYEIGFVITIGSLLGFIGKEDIKAVSKRDSLLNEDIFDTDDPSDVVIAFYPNSSHSRFIVSLITEHLKEISKTADMKLTASLKRKITNGVKTYPLPWEPFESEGDIEAKALNEGPYEGKVRAAVIFNEEDLESRGEKPVRYKIRMKFSSKVPPTTSNIPPFPNSGPNQNVQLKGGGDPITWGDYYCTSGFIGLQILIDKAVLTWVNFIQLSAKVDYKSNAPFPDKIKMQGFPYPSHKKGADIALKHVQIVPKFIMVGFIGIGIAIITGVISEKETGIRELMRMTGVPNWLHLLGYFINNLWVQIIGVTIFCINLTVVYPGAQSAVFDKTSWLLIWVVLFLYAFASTAFCFFITSFFSSKASIVLAFQIVIWMFTYFAPEQFLIVREKYDTLELSEKILFCLLPNVGMLLSIRIIASWEGRYIGSNFSNFATPLSVLDGLSLFHICMMFIADIFLYTFLAIYLENILPSPYGVKKPFYYIFQPATWGLKYQSNYPQETKPELPRDVDAPAERLGKDGNSMIADKSKMHSLLDEKPIISCKSTATDGTGTGFEKKRAESQIGISIKNLRKTFGRKVAVDDVSLDIYRGDITVLLGHNGAGKSTAISILTGMFAPTKGTAVINGYDIKKDLEKIRKTLGLCPQQDMLFEKLTCQEHLVFFARVKGYNKSEAKKEAETLLKLLELTPKAKVQSRHLSGGQKRKLCLANSLIGNTEIVILDEPTSGLDIQARRAVWDVLLELRGQRTIILTTHFMEEADILGDRIAIMAHGNIIFCGSPSFLKKFYGTGYTLTLTNASENNDAPPDRNAILSSVQQFVSNATIKSQNKSVRNEVAIRIPTDPSPNAMFPEMFSLLEKNMKTFRIDTIGMSITTMDEVFMKVGELANICENPDFKPQPSQMILQHVEPSKHSGKQPQVPLLDLEQTKSSETSLLKNPIEVSTDVTNPETIEEETQDEANNGLRNNDGVSPVFDVENRYKSSSEKSEIHAKLKGFPLWIMQFWGLFAKRIICTFRRRLLSFCQMVIPVIVVSAAILQINAILSPREPYPPLELTLLKYSEPTAVYATGDLSLGENYKKSAMGAIVKFVGDYSAQDPLLDAGKRNLATYRERYVIAADLNTFKESNTFTGMFNTIMYHTAPLSLNTISNALSGHLFGINRIVQVTNHPLQSDPLKLLKAADENELRVLAFKSALVFACFLPIGFGLLAGTFVILPVEEKLCKGKQLQMMSGVSPVICFLAAFIWDLILMTFVIGLVLCCFLILEKFTLFTGNNGLIVIFLMLWVFGITAILFSYLYTTFAKSVIGGIMAVSLFHTLPGLIFTLLVTILEIVSSSSEDLYSLRPYAEICRIIGRFFPAYGVTVSAVRFTETAVLNSKCKILIETARSLVCSDTYLRENPSKRICCRVCSTVGNCLKPMDYFTWYHEPSIERNAKNPDQYPLIAGIKQELLYVVLSGVAYLVLYFCMEYQILSYIFNKINKKISIKIPPSEVEDDVLREQQRVKALIDQNKIHEEAFVVDSLCKSYGSFIAVNRLSFAVHPGECFGLLGINGAGKTTTFRMLTGDEYKSDGNAFAWPYSLEKNPLKFYGNVGYCPQFDGITGFMTGKELLVLFARLRGVKRPSAEADKWLIRTGLHDSANAKCGQYSGGMKRRLSTAIALIAEPPIVLLDEPTSGVDPVSQKMFWKIVASVKDTGQAVILTSHSLEECENICSRLGIMVNGQFQCFGGVQHLKNKYAMGFSIMITLKNNLTESMDNVSALNDQVLERFQPAVLKDKHQNLLQYHVNNFTASWGFLFETMEGLKKDFKDEIEDYIISEASLEEVFLSFAKSQKNDKVEVI